MNDTLAHGNAESKNLSKVMSPIGVAMVNGLLPSMPCFPSNAEVAGGGDLVEGKKERWGSKMIHCLREVGSELNWSCSDDVSHSGKSHRTKGLFMNAEHKRDREIGSSDYLTMDRSPKERKNKKQSRSPR